MLLQIVSSLLALQLLSSFSEAYSFDASGKASFCNDNDCPLFTTTLKNQYEVRVYEASNWVETDISNMPFKAAKRAMFWKLFGYIGGQNVNGQKISMTVPVLNKHIKNSNTQSMMFYISNSISNPPQPTDATVRISSMPAFTAYVRSFPGYPQTIQEWEAQKVALEQSLDAAGISYSKAYFVTAGYDAPWVQDRHNEVWLFPSA